MAIYVSNITIPSGEDYEQTFQLENTSSDGPFDLSNYSIYSHLKKHPESLTISAMFNVEIVDDIEGKIQISLPCSITSALRPGRYSYDILIDNGQRKERIIEGSALVTGGVTKINCGIGSNSNL
jgi:hypothetical protein